MPSSSLYNQPFQKFGQLHATVNLHEGQDHCKQNQTGNYTHTKLKTNLQMNVKRKPTFHFPPKTPKWGCSPLNNNYITLNHTTTYHLNWLRTLQENDHIHSHHLAAHFPAHCLTSLIFNNIWIYRNRLPKFCLSYTHVTLTEGQGHAHWYQTVEFSNVYHNIKLKKNLYVSEYEPMVKLLSIKSLKQNYLPWLWTELIKCWKYSSIQHSAQSTENRLLLFHITATLNEGQGYLSKYQNVNECDVFYHTMFERNQSTYVQRQVITFFFLFFSFFRNYLGRVPLFNLDQKK